MEEKLNNIESKNIDTEKDEELKKKLYNCIIISLFTLIGITIFYYIFFCSLSHQINHLIIKMKIIVLNMIKIKINISLVILDIFSSRWKMQRKFFI